jgi:AraC-type DNA-binding domain-containing proteins
MTCPRLPFNLANENFPIARLVYIVFNHSFHEHIRTDYYARINCLFMENATGTEFSKDIAIEAGGLIYRLSNSYSTENMIIVLQVLDALARSDPIRMQSDPSIDIAKIKEVDKIRRAEMIVQYLRENYKHPITLTDLAGHIGLSADHVGDVCQAFLPGGFSGYLRRLRLEEAARLLSYTNYSILAIALDCGYATFSNFMMQFKKEYGMTPGEYRKRKH